MILCCTFDKNKLIACTFDGCSSMKLLEKLLKDEYNKNLIHIHCFAHVNELCFKDSSKSCTLMEESQALCESLYALISLSAKRVRLFEDIQRSVNAQVKIDEKDDVSDSESVLRIQDLSRTRWISRGVAARTILEKREELIQTLQVIIDDANTKTECREKSRGLKYKLNNQKQIFQLITMNELAAILELNSAQLQSSSLTSL